MKLLTVDQKINKLHQQKADEHIKNYFSKIFVDYNSRISDTSPELALFNERLLTMELNTYADRYYQHSIRRR